MEFSVPASIKNFSDIMELMISENESRLQLQGMMKKITWLHLPIHFHNVFDKNLVTKKIFYKGWIQKRNFKWKFLISYLTHCRKPVNQRRRSDVNRILGLGAPGSPTGSDRLGRADTLRASSVDRLVPK